MKRILLSLVLISTSFACNAMDLVGLDKFRSLEQAYKDHPRSITKKQVLTTLADNNYLTNNVAPLIALAEKMQEDEFLIETIDLLEKPSHQTLDSQTIDNCTALLKVILFTHQYAKGKDTDQLVGISSVQTTLDQFNSFNSKDSDNNSFISNQLLQKVGFAAGLIIVSLLSKYTYTKLTRSEKTN